MIDWQEINNWPVLFTSLVILGLLFAAMVAAAWWASVKDERDE